MNAALRTRLWTAAIWLAEAFATLLAIATILAGLLAWSLSRGPISLTRWAPTIETLLGRALPQHSVRFETADLVWNGETRELMLRLNAADIRDREGVRIAEIPSAELAFSARAALLGRLRLEHVVLRGASLEIVREAEGGFALGVGDGRRSGAEAGRAGPTAARLGRALKAYAAGDRPASLAYFESFRLVDGVLHFEDRRTGRRWRAPDADLEVQAAGRRADLDLSAALELGGPPVTLTANGALAPDAETGEVESVLDVRFEGLDPARLGAVFPELRGLAGLDAPLAGQVGLGPGPLGAVPVVTLDLTLGAGHYDPGLHDVEPLPVGGAAFSGLYLPEAGRIKVQRFDFDFAGSTGTLTGTVRPGRGDATWAFDLVGEPLTLWVPIYSELPAEIDRLALKGAVDTEAGALFLEGMDLAAGSARLSLAGEIETHADRSPRIRLSGDVQAFPVPLLRSYWPMGRAMGARDWIAKNIGGGTIGTGRLEIDAPAGGFDEGFIPNEMLRFEFTLEDATIRYVPDLTPMYMPKADAVLEGNRFTVVGRNGRIGRSVAVHEARMETENFHIKGSPGVFYGRASGDTAEMVGLLDMGPFGYPSRYGFDPSRLGGTGEVSLEVSLPLRRNVRIEQIDFGAAARVRDFSLPGLFPAVALREGTIDVNVSPLGLEGKGRAALNGIPVEVEWYETFRNRGPMPSRYVIAADIGPEERETLGLSGLETVTGRTALTLEARGEGRRIREASLDADLTQAGFALDDFGWAKAPGDAAGARAVLEIPKSGGYRLTEARLLGAGADIEGHLRLAADGQLLEADFPRFVLGTETDIRFAAARADDHALVLTLTGESLNAKPFLRDLGFGEGVAARRGSPVRLESRIGRVVLRNGVTLRDAELDFRHDGEATRHLHLQGTLPGGSALNADLAPLGDRGRRLSIVAEDAGALASGIYGYPSLSGGRAALTADVGADGRTEGRLDATDFSISDLPLLAKLLSVASLTGIGDVLGGEGIGFRALEVPFHIDAEGVVLEDARAWGPTLGLTLQGRIGRAGAGQNDLTGTIVPAYAINSALGEIPLLGPLFTNREGEGVVAITYRIEGTLADPRIVVNPLSALAPGLLRRVFEGGGDAGAGGPDGDAPAGDDAAAEPEDTSTSGN